MRIAALLVLGACASATQPRPGRPLNAAETGAVHMTLLAMHRHGIDVHPRCNDDLRALRMRTVPHLPALRYRCRSSVAGGCVHEGVIWTARTQDERERLEVVIHETLHTALRCTYDEGDSYHLLPGVWLRYGADSTEALARELTP